MSFPFTFTAYPTPHGQHVTLLPREQVRVEFDRADCVLSTSDHEAIYPLGSPVRVRFYLPDYEVTDWFTIVEGDPRAMDRANASPHRFEFGV